MGKLNGWLAFGGFAIAVIFALGLWRLLDDPGAPRPLAESESRQLAACLPQRELPLGAVVTLAQVVTSAPSSKSIAPEVLVTSAVRLDIAPEALPATDDWMALPGGTAVIGKKNGGIEIRVPPEAELLLRRSAGEYVVRTVGTARFGLVDDIPYLVSFPGVKVRLRTVDKERRAFLEPGTSGSLQLGTGQGVSLLQPLLARHWVTTASPTLMPTRVSGQPGLGSVAVEVNEPSMRFDNESTALTACASQAGNTWVMAGVARVDSERAGSAKVLVTLPASALPHPQDRLAELRIALVSADGKLFRFGGFNAVGRQWAAVFATGFTLLLFGILTARNAIRREKSGQQKRWFSGLFVGPDNDPSLSLLQMFIWTVIAVWGYVYVFVVAGTLLNMTVEVMSLLGIAGVTTVLARAIATRSGGSTSQVGAASVSTGSATAPGPAAGRTRGSSSTASTAPADSGDDFWRMLSTNGSFDLLKLQLFVFTIVIAMYVVWRIVDSAAFPELDTNTVLLLGVSQGVYVVGKAAATAPLSRAQALRAEIDFQTEALATLKLDPATQSTWAAAEAKIQQLSAEYETALGQLGLRRA